MRHGIMLGRRSRRRVASPYAGVVHADTTGQPSTIMRPVRWALAATAVVVVLLLGAGALIQQQFEPDFLPFLMSIVAGAVLGVTVTSLLRLLPSRVGPVVHLAVTLGGWAGVWWMTQADMYAALPASAHGTAYAVMLALPPALAWLSLTLIGWISALARRPAVQLINPEWVHEPRRATISFPAVETTLRTLTIWIVAVVLIGGLGIAALLIATGDAALMFGPRFMLVLLAVVFGIPAYVGLVAVLRRRQADYQIQFGMDRVEVHSKRGDRTVRYEQIRDLWWGGGGEYSRLRVRTTSGERLEIVAGLAKLPRGRGAVLPPLPRVVQMRLENAGLVNRSKRRGGAGQGAMLFVRQSQHTI